MSNKLFNGLLLFSLFGIAMWFFGNLYEAIVIAPNLLSDAAVRLDHWQHYFVVTNPVFFYVPVPQLATVVLVLLFFITGEQKAELKKLLLRAVIFQVCSVVLSVYIITQINMKLFFGDLQQYASQASFMAVTWNILNIIRVILVGVALAYVLKAYVYTQKNEA